MKHFVIENAQIIGIHKEIDNLGRIQIPKDMRKMFSLEGTVELVVTKDGVLIRNPQYILCKKDEYGQA